MFDLFLTLAYYQPGQYLVSDLEPYIDDLYWKVCCHIDETIPNNLVEYQDIEKTKLHVNTLDVPKISERLNSMFFQVAQKFGAVFSLKLYKQLDTKPDGSDIPIELLLNHVNKIKPASVPKLYRNDIENFLDMYEYKTKKTFKRV